MHLRRALLLFAVVLGMAALAASISRPANERSTDRAEQRPAEPQTPTVRPLPTSEPRAPVSLDAAGDQSKRIAMSEASTVEVTVDEPGNVEIPGLGLSAPADPLTPARFELFPSKEGAYEVEFTPVTAGVPEPAGRLVVTSGG